jgi:poly-gamma-glutamate synthesis protein (capsule biosynthesis protein)
MKKRFLAATLAVCFCLGLTAAGCTREVPEEVLRELEQRHQTSSSKKDKSSISSSKPSEKDDPLSNNELENSSSEPEETISSVTLKAVGDNLIHNTIYIQAQNRASNGQAYDFYPAYEKIAELLEGADFAFINQETLLASEVFEPSSYPMFNSPTEVGDTMLELGFNLFSHSNNHALDKGVKGINATLDYWENKEGLGEDFLVTGLFRDENDMNHVRVMEKNGISLALVAFTEHTNGLKLPSAAENKIIYTNDTETIKNQIQAADQTADVVIVSVHWGIENSHEVTDAQRDLAQKMFDWGADIILGTHPHVLQPVESITSTNGERQGYVIYSLGNFISAQDAADNLVGGILDFTIYKNMGTGEISIGQPSLTPVVTHYETAWQKNLSLYPLSEYTEELAEFHGVRRNYPNFSVDYIWGMLEEVIGETYLQEKPMTEDPGDTDEPPPES